jgi:hypothetical protein
MHSPLPPPLAAADPVSYRLEAGHEQRGLATPEAMAATRPQMREIMDESAKTRSNRASSPVLSPPKHTKHYPKPKVYACGFQPLKRA